MAGTIVTQHAKQRIQERNKSVTSAALAKRNAKIAYNSGYKISTCRTLPAHHCLDASQERTKWQ